MIWKPKPTMQIATEEESKAFFEDLSRKGAIYASSQGFIGEKLSLDSDEVGRLLMLSSKSVEELIPLEETSLADARTSVRDAGFTERQAGFGVLIQVLGRALLEESQGFSFATIKNGKGGIDGIEITNEQYYFALSNYVMDHFERDNFVVSMLDLKFEIKALAALRKKKYHQ